MSSVETPPFADRPALLQSHRALLQELIDTDSTSGREASVALVLERILRERGYRVERQEVSENRWNILGSSRSRGRGEADLVCCTHLDCVPPFFASRFDADRIHGRGACDTKGGLVAMLEAADALDPDRERISFLLVVGEEVDHCGASKAAELAWSARAVVLCEPTENRLGLGQKGLLKVVLRSVGSAAHSAYPELGRDALLPLLDVIERLRRAPYPSHPVLGATHLNVGLIEGGVAANVIPPSARAELLYRVVSDENALWSFVRDWVGSDVTPEVVSMNPPVELHAVPGFETTLIPFNTDAYYLRAMGPVYLVGPGDIRVAHTDHEHLRFEDFYAGIEIYSRLFARLLG